MKDMFLCLLLNLGKFGDVNEALMYSNNFSIIKLKNGNEEYSVSITRKEMNSEDKEDA